MGTSRSRFLVFSSVLLYSLDQITQYFEKLLTLLVVITSQSWFEDTRSIYNPNILTFILSDDTQMSLKLLVNFCIVIFVKMMFLWMKMSVCAPFVSCSQEKRQNHLCLPTRLTKSLFATTWVSEKESKDDTAKKHKTASLTCRLQQVDKKLTANRKDEGIYCW